MFVIFFRKFASPGQPCQGVHQDSQICNKNHIFVTSLASFFCDRFSKFFVFATHKINSGIAPVSKTPHSAFSVLQLGYELKKN